MVAIDTTHIIPIKWPTVSVSSAFDERGDQCGTTGFSMFCHLGMGHHGTNVLGNPKRTLMASNPILGSY